MFVKLTINQLPGGGTRSIWERPYVRQKIWLPKSDPYSAVKFRENSYPYSAFFKIFSPVRAKFFSIFRKIVQFFLKISRFNPEIPQFYPKIGHFCRKNCQVDLKLAVYCNYLPLYCIFVISYPYSALTKPSKTHPYLPHVW